MTVYSTDLARLAATVRETLVRRVAPGVTGEAAQHELAAVIEAMDNLTSRLAWDPDALDAVCQRSEQLADRLGLSSLPTGATGVARLRASRQEISAMLDGVYRAGVLPDDLLDAVGEFTRDDVLDQISVALRPAMED